MSFHNRKSDFLFPAVILTALVIVTCGCGSSSSGKANATGQASFDKGMELVRSENWEEALAQFETVISSGSVNPDQAGELYAYQALALAKLGKFDESAEALKIAREGADQGLVDKIASQN